MNNIQKILTDSIKELIEHSSSTDKISSLKKKHSVKLHFVPYKYRVFGGVLQSMNIQFGNFLEKVMDEVIRENPENQIIDTISGKKNISFMLSRDSERIIDEYISNCQFENYSESQLKLNYTHLLNSIKANETNINSVTVNITHDVDILFKNLKSNTYYYVEVKYNDDHDTGKFVDINRKFLKTYAYLQRALGDKITLKPILFYFNNKKMKGNIYLPEEEAIYRGRRFFETFTTISYQDMDLYMKNISESPETIKVFDELYKKVVCS